MGNKMSHNNENHSDAAPGGMAGGGGAITPYDFACQFRGQACTG